MGAFFGKLIGFRRIAVFILTSVAAPALIKAGVPADTVAWMVKMAIVVIGGISLSDAARGFGVTTPPPHELSPPK